MRFPMTLDWRVKATTALVAVMVLGVLPLQAGVFATLPVPAPARAGFFGLLALVAGVLLVAVLWAPRAVRLSLEGLSIERVFWPEYFIPWSEVASVEEGPDLRPFGAVMRVAGNGGLMGYSGLFAVRGVGLVRCWATRLYAPTIVVRRRTGRPVLLGVDDTPALLEELRKRLGVLAHRRA